MKNKLHGLKKKKRKKKEKRGNESKTATKQESKLYPL